MRQYSIIIAGCRSFTNYKVAKNFIDQVLNSNNINKYEISCIISGCARGADQLGERYANENNINLVQCPAEWDKYGSGAGYKRNREMRDLAIADGHTGVLIAFWDNESSGTRNMISLARKRNMMVFICDISAYKKKKFGLMNFFSRN